MKELKWKILRDAQSLIDTLPKKPLVWGVVGSVLNKKNPSDLDICLIYQGQKEGWQRDKKVWLKGYKIPFDLFFFFLFAPEEAESSQYYLKNLDWRGDIENISAPSPHVERELFY